MKFLVIFACIVLTINAASDQELWQQFKSNYEKSYKSLREEKLRFLVFQENLRTIEKHNAKYDKEEVSWYMGVTKFADLTQEEFVQHLTLNIATKPKTTGEFYVPPANFTVPDTFDWRQNDVKAVLEVKDQGSCGSCWAFSTTGALEGQNIIKHGVRISLSEQNLVDCGGEYGNLGCGGGDMSDAYDYVRHRGIESEATYPYTGIDGTCKFNSSRSVLRVTGMTAITPNENALKAAVASAGPIAVAINSKHLSLYSGGIFDDEKCAGKLNHAVLAVGYGSVNNTDYWIVKNSWGVDFGEDGYVRMSRNKNNQCGIANDPSFPLV